MSGPDSVDVYQAGASLRTLLACIENSNEENAAEVLLAAEAVEKVVSCVQRFGSHPAVVIPGLQVLTGLAGKGWGGRLLQREGTPQAVATVVMRGLCSGDQNVRLAACRAVNALVSRQPGYDEALGSAGACDELLKVMREFGLVDASAWRVVMDAMAAMARSHDGNRQAFRRGADAASLYRRPTTLTGTSLLDVMGPREALHELAARCRFKAAGLDPNSEAIVAELRAFADKGCCTCSWDTSLPCRHAADETGLATAPALKTLEAVLQASDYDVIGSRTRACCMAVQSLASGCVLMARVMATGQVLEGVARLLDIGVPVSLWSSACMAVGALVTTGCVPDVKLGPLLLACQGLWAERPRCFLDDPGACSAICYAIAAVASNGPRGDDQMKLHTCREIVMATRSFAGDRRMAMIGCYTVAALARAVPRAAESLIEAGAFEAVVSAMRNFRDKGICLLGCEAIETLAPVRTVTPDPRTLRQCTEAVATAMQATLEDGPVAKAAVSALQCLCERSNECVEALVWARGDARVVDAMRTWLSLDLCFDVVAFKTACQVVAMLARFDNQTEQMVAARVCEAALEGLSVCQSPDTQSESAREYACVMVTELTQRQTGLALGLGRDDIKEAMGRLGVCGAMVAVLRAFLNIPDVTCRTLKAMAALSKGVVSNQHAMRRAGAYETLVAVLKAFRDSSKVMHAGLKAVRALSEGAGDHQYAMRAAGACEVVVAALKGFKDNVRVRVAALKAVTALSEGMPSNQHAMRAAGACEVVVAILRAHPGRTVVALAGLRAVAALSDGIVSNQNALEAVGACRVVSGVMQAARGRVQPHVTLAGLEAISSLSRGHLANSMALWQAGACAEVAAVAPAHVPDAGVYVLYSKAVALLAAYHAGSRAALGSVEVCRAVYNAMETFPLERDMQIWGCMAIASLAGRDMGNKQHFGPVGGWLAPMDVLLNFPQDGEACNCACQALYALILRDHDRQLYLVNVLNFSQTVLAAVRHHTSDPPVCLWACRLVALFAGNRREAQQAMAAAGACDYVSEVLVRHCDSDRDVCDAACRALLSLARNSPTNQAAMRAAGTCEPVVKVLRAAIAKGQRTLCLLGCDAVRALAAEGSEGQAELQVFMACEAVVAALGAFPYEAGVWQRAGRAMAKLADGHADCQAALKAARACEVVMKGLQAFASDRLVTQACCAAIAALAIGQAECQQLLHLLGTESACRSAVALLQASNRARDAGARAAAFELVAALSDGMPGIQNAMRAAGACEAVVAAMQTRPRTHAATLAGLDAIYGLARMNVGNQMALGQAGACGALREVMDDVRQTSGSWVRYCRAVTVLAVTNAGNRAALGGFNMGWALGRVSQQFPGERQVQVWGCLAVASLTDRDVDGKTVFFVVDASIPPMSAINTFPQDRDVCECACRALYAIAWRTQLLYYSLPACVVILQGVRNHTTDPAVSLWACRLIALFASIFRLNQQAMAAAGACDYIAQVLNRYCDGDRYVCDAACRVLLSLARDSPANQAAMRAAGACEPVVKVLRAAIAKGQRTLCLLGCDAVRALAIESWTAQAELQLFGACEAVVAAPRAFADKAAVWQRAGGAMAALANRHADCRTALIRAGACEVLMEGLQAVANDRLVSRSCCTAIAALAIGQAECQQLLHLLGTESACRSMAALLQASNRATDASARAAALKAVAALSDGMPGIQNAMRAAGACEAVAVAMQTRPRTHAATLAGLDAVYSLARMNVGNQMALGQAGVCGALREVMDDVRQTSGSWVRYCRAVTVLAVTNAGNRAALGGTDLYLALRATLEQFPGERKVQVWGCLAVASLTSRVMDESERLTTVDMWHQPANAMLSFLHDRDVCESAYRALYTSVSRRKLSCDAYVSAALAQALQRHTTDPAVSLWACRLIALLAGASRANQRTMATAGVCVVVSQVLVRHCDSDHGVCDAACRALLSLARDSPTNQFSMRAAGACDPVVKVLRAAIAKGRHTLCLLGCDAVRALAIESWRAQAVLQMFGACEALIAALRAFPREASIWQRACGAVAALAHRHAGCQTALGTLGACEVVMGGMQAFASDRLVSQACCGAIAALAMGHAENQQKLGAMGACGLVVDVMARFYDDGAVQYHACRAVTALATGHVDNGEALRRAGACEAVKEALRLGGPDWKLCLAAEDASRALASAKRPRGEAIVAPEAEQSKAGGQGRRPLAAIVGMLLCFGLLAAAIIRSAVSR